MEPGAIGFTAAFAAGRVLVAMGIAMVTGHLSRIAFWLLEMRPALGRIG
jgi:cytochrome c-type biogenesis protein